MFELPGPRRISRPAVPGALKTPPVLAGKVKRESGSSTQQIVEQTQLERPSALSLEVFAVK